MNYPNFCVRYQRLDGGESTYLALVPTGTGKPAVRTDATLAEAWAFSRYQAVALANVYRDRDQHAPADVVHVSGDPMNRKVQSLEDWRGQRR